MPAISRLVAIGRRMKISETFITFVGSGKRSDPKRGDSGVRPLNGATQGWRHELLTSTALPASAAAAAASSSGRRAAGIGGDARALFESQLPFGDHHFARLQTFFDDEVLIDALS